MVKFLIPIFLFALILVGVNIQVLADATATLQSPSGGEAQMRFVPSTKRFECTAGDCGILQEIEWHAVGGPVNRLSVDHSGYNLECDSVLTLRPNWWKPGSIGGSGLRGFPDAQHLGELEVSGLGACGGPQPPPPVNPPPPSGDGHATITNGTRQVTLTANNGTITAGSHCSEIPLFKLENSSATRSFASGCSQSDWQNGGYWLDPWWVVQAIGCFSFSGSTAAKLTINCGRTATPPPPVVTDSDGDGVPDSRDRCPGTPYGVRVDSYGCPLNVTPPPDDSVGRAAAGAEILIAVYRDGRLRILSGCGTQLSTHPTVSLFSCEVQLSREIQQRGIMVSVPRHLWLKVGKCAIRGVNPWEVFFPPGCFGFQNTPPPAADCAGIIREFDSNGSGFVDDPEILAAVRSWVLNLRPDDRCILVAVRTWVLAASIGSIATASEITPAEASALRAAIKLISRGEFEAARAAARGIDAVIESEPRAEALRVQHATAQKLGSSEYRLSVNGRGIESINVQVFALNGKAVFTGEAMGNALRFIGLANDGQPLANGVYLYVVTARGYDGSVWRSKVQKIALLR